METPNISSLEYHLRMLQDIAKQEHGCLVTGYFNLDTCTAAHILVGNTLDISAVLLCIIDKICEKQAFSPKEYCEILMSKASDKKVEKA
jgi:hypothetical protein